MPGQGERWDELLSGLLDSRLSDAERQRVQRALDEDAALRKRLEELRAVSRRLKELDVPAPPLPSNFSDRVIAAARAEAAHAGLPVDHYVRRGSPAVHHPGRTRRSWTTRPSVAWLTGLAAALVLAVSLPTWLAPEWFGPGEPGPDAIAVRPTVPTPEPSSGVGAAADSPTERSFLAGQRPMAAPLSMVWVTDIAVTEKALAEGVLYDVLGEAGISFVDPLVATPDINRAITDALMIVRSAEAERIQSQAMILYIRARAAEIDRALQLMGNRPSSFVGLSHNLAIDLPHVQLMQKLSARAEDKYGDQALAAPVVAHPAEGTSFDARAQYDAGERPQRLVSTVALSGQRTALSNLAPGLDENAFSTALFVIHVAR